MVDPKVKEILSTITTTPYGRALQLFLEDQIKDLSDLEKIQSWDETLGNKKAIQTLKKLFALMKIQVTEKKQGTYE